MFPPGIEPGTFRVLGGCDNHYTTETEVRADVSEDKSSGLPVTLNQQWIMPEVGSGLHGNLR